MSFDLVSVTQERDLALQIAVKNKELAEQNHAELEQLRAGYAGAVEEVQLVINSLGDVARLGGFAPNVDPVRYCSAIRDNLKEALSSTPQSVKDVMDVLEAAKEEEKKHSMVMRLTSTLNPSEETINKCSCDLCKAVRKLEGK